MKHAREDYNRIQDPEGKIPECEPVFLLRGQDISAPLTLRFWAQQNELNGGDEQLTDAAYAHADAMDEWQRYHKRKPATA